MRFNNIHFSEEIASEFGLKEIKLEKLGSVIALVGKNGSGKTRCLNLINKHFDKITNYLDYLNDNIAFYPSELKAPIDQLLPYKEYIIKSEDIKKLEFEFPFEIRDDFIHLKIEKLKEELTNIEINSVKKKYPHINNFNLSSNQIKLKSTINLGRKVINDNKGILENLNEQNKNNYLKYIDSKLISNLQSQFKLEKESDNYELYLDSKFKGELNEFEVINKTALIFFKQLPHFLVKDWRENLGNEKLFSETTSFQKFKKFKEIFEQLMNKTIKWEEKKSIVEIHSDKVVSTSIGMWIINDDREFKYEELSEGEKLLFAYVFALFLLSQNSSVKLSESIIVIDEPELHLHPDAEIMIIEKLKEIVKDKGQLIIATHSINILSHLNNNEIFVVKDNQIISPFCKTQETALTELLGIEDKIERLNAFFRSTFDSNYIQFINECFEDPNVIMFATQNDSQIITLDSIIKKVGPSCSSLLEFGAGKGRVINQLKLLNENLKIDFNALELEEKNHIILKEHGINTIYQKHDQLPKDKFDLIFLCNVLHEINIDEWIPTLNKIIASLNANGNLIIMETKYLINGEKIKPIGFLLLDLDEIKNLFGVEEKSEIFINKEYSDKNTCLMINKKDISLVTNDRIMSTIDLLNKNTLTKISNFASYNTIEFSAKNGRYLAFLYQQYFNSKFTIDYLSQN